MAPRALSLLLAGALLCPAFLSVSGEHIEFDLASYPAEKCLSDELGDTVVVEGTVSYELQPSENDGAAKVRNDRGLDVIVFDPKRVALSSAFNLRPGLPKGAKTADGSVDEAEDGNEETSGGTTFSFTTSMDGEHRFCFKNSGKIPKRVKFNLDVGADVRYKKAARGAHFEPVASALIKIEFEIESLYKKLEDLRLHELEMERVTRDTQNRVTYFSLFTMVILASFGLWQTCHLHNFFKAKKLI
jgi:hypothetical protein